MYCLFKVFYQQQSPNIKKQNMQKHESVSQYVEVKDQVYNSDQKHSKVSQQIFPPLKMKSPQNSQSNIQAMVQKQRPKQIRDELKQKQIKAQTSVENISMQSLIQKTLAKSEAKINEKTTISLNNKEQKIQMHSKQIIKQETIPNSITKSESYMKSSIKSSHKVKKINKPFYEETFYITGMKQNYLLLLSDTNQVLQFPVGMFTTQGQNVQTQNLSEEVSNNNENYHLIKDIKIGQPIKIKLEFDFLRQQKDDKIFHSLQKVIHSEYSLNSEQPVQTRNKQISLKRNK